MSEFDKIVEDTVELTRKTLQSKGKEYSQNSDRFSNFRRAARLLGCSAENALLGMKVKHDVSVLDIVNNLDNELPTKELLDEKIGDSINYLILLKGLIYERIKKGLPF